MDTTPIQRLPTEEDVFDLQTGSDRQLLSLDEQHFFDIAGYALLPEVLNPGQIEESRQRLESLAQLPSKGVSLRPGDGSEVELINIIEAGGVLEDAMALQPVLRHLQALIWGRQFRLIASRARIRGVGSRGRLTQGGKADPRRYSGYRCGPGGRIPLPAGDLPGCAGRHRCGGWDVLPDPRKPTNATCPIPMRTVSWTRFLPCGTCP